MPAGAKDTASVDTASVDTASVDTARAHDTQAGTTKAYRGACDRVVSPAATWARVEPLLQELGITRVANITGLDRIGISTAAVYRPNSRSLSVAQGKGASWEEARVSGVMESIELHHAETIHGPLFLGSYHELAQRHPIVDVGGLPQVTMSTFSDDMPLLWMAGVDLATGDARLVPFELVHTDFRTPFPTGSGAFLMSSNGLASGNHLLEAMSHAICELIERDANTLWHLSSARARAARRLDPATIVDEAILELLARLERAAMEVGLWETTSDVGVSSFLCTVVDRDPREARPMPPVSGSGTHPLPKVALLRAITEAAQGRLTIIAGARDDQAGRAYDEREARERADEARARLAAQRPVRDLAEAPVGDHTSVEEDVSWELQRLAAAGLHEVVAVNLTQARWGIPVVRVIIPHLEAMSEVRGYAPGRRARQRVAEAA